MKNRKRAILRLTQHITIFIFAAVCLTFLTNTPSTAEEEVTTDAGTMDVKQAAKPFKKMEVYSPYAGWNYPMHVYWGDTHLHTSFSMDAGAFGARLTPKDAWRFAKGKEITASSDQLVK